MDQAVESGTITASVNYLRDTGVTPYNYTGGPGSTVVESSGTLEPHDVTMHDGRPMADRFILDRDGFHFREHATQVADFYDPDQIASVYYPEMEALIKEETGASRVLVFDHTVRTADDDDRERRKIREPVLRVHNDYTEWSGPQRVRDLVPDEAEV
jgi:hypothetical protein